VRRTVCLNLPCIFPICATELSCSVPRRLGHFLRRRERLKNATGKAQYQKLLSADLNRQIEKVGAQLRSRMSWLQEKRA